MGEVEFVSEAPPERRQRSKWEQMLQPFLGRPGEWGRIDMLSEARAKNAAQNLRAGVVKAPDGEWDFRSHGTWLYAMYVGEADTRKVAKLAR